MAALFSDSFTRVVGAARGAGLPRYLPDRDATADEQNRRLYGPRWADVVEWLERDIPYGRGWLSFTPSQIGSAPARERAAAAAADEGRGTFVEAAHAAGWQLVSAGAGRLADTCTHRQLIADIATALVCADILDSQDRKALYQPWCESVSGWNGFPHSWQELSIHARQPDCRRETPTPHLPLSEESAWAVKFARLNSK